MKKKSRASIVNVQSKLAKVGTDVIVPDAAATADNGAANEAETSVSGGTTNGNGNLNGDHEEEDMDTTTSSSLAFNCNGSRIGNGSADYLEYFNSDIICHHGQLCYHCSRMQASQFISLKFVSSRLFPVGSFVFRW